VNSQTWLDNYNNIVPETGGRMKGLEGRRGVSTGWRSGWVEIRI